MCGCAEWLYGVFCVARSDAAEYDVAMKKTAIWNPFIHWDAEVARKLTMTWGLIIKGRDVEGEAQVNSDIEASSHKVE